MGNFRVFDPRVKADFRLAPNPSGPMFSSVAAGFLVVDAQTLHWQSLADRLESAFAAAAPCFFVLYRPWWPGLKSKQAEFVRQFPNAADWDGVLFSSSSGIAIKQTFTLRDRLGGSKSGVWLLGTCDEVHALVNALRQTNVFADPAVFIAAESAHALEAALALDEGGASTCLLRLGEAVTESADRLVAGVGAVGRQETD